MEIRLDRLMDEENIKEDAMDVPDCLENLIKHADSVLIIVQYP